MGLGVLSPEIVLQNFYPPNMDKTCGNSPIHASDSPTGLDGCGFLNSVAVRLPLNLISDGSQ